MTDRVDDLMAKWQSELPEALVPSTEFGKRVMVLATALDEATRATVAEFGLTGADFGVLAASRSTRPLVTRRFTTLLVPPLESSKELRSTVAMRR